MVAGFRDDIMEQRAFTVRLKLRKGNRTPMHLAFRCSCHYADPQ